MPGDDATDPLDAILAAPPGSADEAGARAQRLRLRNQRVEANLPLVLYYAGRFAGRGVATEDLIQLGSIALIRAVELHDPSRGELGMYAGIWVRSAMRQSVEHGRVEGPVEPPDDVPDPGAVDPPAGLAEAELSAAIRAAVGRLPGRHRVVVEGRYGLDGGPPLTLVEVAARLGVSKQRAHALEGAALATLRGLLGRHGAGLA